MRPFLSKSHRQLNGFSKAKCRDDGRLLPALGVFCCLPLLPYAIARRTRCTSSTGRPCSPRPTASPSPQPSSAPAPADSGARGPLRNARLSCLFFKCNMLHFRSWPAARLFYQWPCHSFSLHLSPKGPFIHTRSARSIYSLSLRRVRPAHPFSHFTLMCCHSTCLSRLLLTELSWEAPTPASQSPSLSAQLSFFCFSSSSLSSARKAESARAPPCPSQNRQSRGGPADWVGCCCRAQPPADTLSAGSWLSTQALRTPLSDGWLGAVTTVAVSLAVP